MNQSVGKALDILELLKKQASQTPLALKTIADHLSMPKPTAYRILQTLESRGFVTKDKPSDTAVYYRLGLKLLELGTIVSEQLELRSVALPFMTDLRDSINEIVHLVIRDQFEGVYIEKVEGEQPLRLHTKIGKRSPLHLGSGPKLLLAMQEDSFIDEYIKALNQNNLWDYHLMNKQEILGELRSINGQGYAISKGEQDPETIGLSYPIYDHTGAVLAALTVSGPAIRFFGERGQSIQKQTDRTAQRISEVLGYRKVDPS
ncbi:IclR family transcriptional regulator [Tuberibacillus sp. Marseille-P3662]|uniref:IclR family transcriptional regulator n=1 Tax=Tuberibacillus sp. Marseille-P3662 TaxID=1965358 RepID=UPI000A1CDD93|nr:IclR family transcriptional regulator [Tuberibacillus sp. Marseille-P3662]